MSVTAQRSCYVLLGLATVALRLLISLVLSRWSWDLDNFWAYEFLLLSPWLALIPAFAVGVLIAARGAPSRATFLVEGGAFVARPAIGAVGPQAVLLIFLGSNAFPTSAMFGGPDLIHLKELWPISAVILLGFWAVGILLLFSRTPDLRLTPTGVTQRSLVGVPTLLPWTSLRPGHPELPRKRRGGWYFLLDVDLTPIRAPQMKLVYISQYRVDGDFAARAIRHYVEHPEDRELIGTDEGLVRLTRDLAAQPA